ncbi:MAG TPA: ABC transporter permease [Acidobacteriota bacterium]|nr:ABC transporter permease [Acidobacteriota bacterium]HNG94513.1 ABC transporter permease [Acidobacteriota bacterium]
MNLTAALKKLLSELLFPIIAVIAAFVIGGVIVLCIGDSPLLVYELFFSSAFGTLDGISYTLFYATPLIFTGLAVALAFHCGLLNIGCEGQLSVAAFATAWVGFTLPVYLGEAVSPTVKSLILIPACILGGIVMAGLWGAVPGFLKAKFGSHEVINTIMLNFIAAAIVSYLTQYHFRTVGDQILETFEIDKAAHIPRFHHLLAPLGITYPERLPLNIGFIIALLTCVAVYVFLWKTKWGYELRAVGNNASAAEYGGISVKRNIILAMTISGGLAGMVAISEVLGYRHRYYDGFSPGYGFTGIAVALLGRNHPVGILLSAVLFGALIRAGLFIDIFTDHVSKDLSVVLQAIIIICVACEGLFRGTLLKRFQPEK